MRFKRMPIVHEVENNKCIYIYYDGHLMSASICVERKPVLGHFLPVRK